MFSQFPDSPTSTCYCISFPSACPSHSQHAKLASVTHAVGSYGAPQMTTMDSVQCEREGRHMPKSANVGQYRPSQMYLLLLFLFTPYAVKQSEQLIHRAVALLLTSVTFIHNENSQSDLVIKDRTVNSPLACGVTGGKGG